MNMQDKTLEDKFNRATQEFTKLATGDSTAKIGVSMPVPVELTYAELK
jgi:hypothetical protein